MKSLPCTLLALSLLTAHTALGSLGPGPWASGAYYPGGTDGKYQAAVYGNNIAGVIGFAIREGSPTVLAQTNTAAPPSSADEDSVAATTFAAATAAAQAFDQTQNYFVIFVEGRTYTGLAVGSVNPRGKTVTGALLGAQPDFGFIEENLPFEFPDPTFVTNFVITDTGRVNQEVTVTPQPGFTTTNIEVIQTVTNVFIDGLETITNTFITNTNIVTVDPILITNTNNIPIFMTNTNVTAIAPDTPSFPPQATTNTFDPLPLLNRGVSGGFQAKLRDRKAYMSFRGSGELSAPNLPQTVSLATNSAGDTITGSIQTATASFRVDGLRTSFATTFAPAAPTTATTTR